MKKIAVVLSLLVFSAHLWAFDFPKPAALPKPTAEMRSFQVQAISLRDVTFLFDLAVKNPYPVPLSFKGMTLAFTVEGVRVFTASSQGGFTVPANGEKVNEFTVTLAYEGIMKLVTDYTSRDWLTTVINGTLEIPLPKIPGLQDSVTFTFSLTTKIPAIKPRVALLDFRVLPPSREQVAEAIGRSRKGGDVDSAHNALSDILAGKDPSTPGFDPADLDVPLAVSFTLEIGNEAKAPLSFDKLGYELTVNGESLVAGESTEIVREPGRDLVTVRNVFSSAKLSRNVRSLFAAREGSFGIKGNALIKLPDEIRKEPLPLAFDEAGSFSLK
ncbi:MAG: LEA type 2 family protein [Spirochaetia bacterium]